MAAIGKVVRPDQRFRQRGHDWRDNLDDATHVALGASLASLPFAFIPAAGRLAAGCMGALYLIWLAVLAAGIRKRLKGARNE